MYIKRKLLFFNSIILKNSLKNFNIEFFFFNFEFEDFKFRSKINNEYHIEFNILKKFFVKKRPTHPLFFNFSWFQRKVKKWSKISF
jgi:hypothetical protein